MELRRFVLLAGLVVGLVSTGLGAESFEARHRRELAGNPSDLHFRLTVEGNGRAFQRGERIPIVLEFWSESTDRYKLNGATYDRSGRLPTEEFRADREDVTDPFADYFFSGVIGWMMGGARSSIVLSAQPARIEMDLNDWFRFDRPGRYRFYLKSHRLAREAGAGEEGRVVAFAAVSNVMEIDIAPDDPAWLTAKLREIEGALMRGEQEHRPVSAMAVAMGPTEEERRAWRELRYLGDRAALPLAFRAARQSRVGPDALTLVGQRDREAAVEEYDRYLADPATPVREQEIRLRALFTWTRKEAPKPLPTYLWQRPPGVEAKDVLAEAEARQERFDKFVEAEAVRLIPTLASKEEEARAITAAAIAAITPREARAAGIVPADEFGLSREELIARFPTMAENQQSELLGAKWDLVRGPEMIPVLRAVMERTEAGSLPRSALELGMWGAGNGVGEKALRRLSELSHKEAEELVALDLASGKTRFAGFAVREMRARAIVEADGAFSRWLSTGEFGMLPLIAKFGSTRVVGEMSERYRERSWPCAEEASFVTYFVRVMPEEAAANVLRSAMANREKRGCHQFLLGQVGREFWNPVMERQAIASLDDADTETVLSAVQSLSAQGSAAAEAALWRRLEQWSERWRGRTTEFAVHPIRGGTPPAESRLGPELFRGITSARSWVVDEARRQRLVGLCLDEECREAWSRARLFGKPAVEVSHGGGMYPAAFRVDGYQASTFEALQEKLTQYPQGTVFRWCPQAFDPFDGFTPGQREEMYERLRVRLAARSMSIEPYSKDSCLARKN